MLLVEKKRLTEQLSDANVLIASFEEDRLAVTEMMTEFNIVGLNYTFLGKGKNVRNDYWYWRASEDSLKKASCLVLIMSKTVFEEQNSPRKESFWFEAGYMEARGQKVIPFVLDIPRNEWDEYLGKTPIRQMQATNSLPDLIAQIEQTRPFKKSFFFDRTVAHYGNARVFYAEMTVLMNIRKDLVDGILQRLQILDDDEIQTRSDVLKLLQKEINFGVKLHRFGKECFIQHPYYSAYLEESKVLDMDCNALNQDNRFSLLSQNGNGNGYAIKVDFIIPNHEVLGVAVKPYMEINKNSPIRKADLLNLLKTESTQEVFEGKLDAKLVSTEKTERVYFNLYFDDDTMLIDCNDENIGKTCNYVYAK